MAILPVAGVLLWIHRRRVVDLPLIHFAAIRFIQPIVSQSRSSSKLSHHLLLLLRLLMMTVLIAGFASPVWQGADQRSAGGCTLLLVDATASMCRSIDNQSAWDRARQQTVTWLSNHPDQSVLIGVLNDQLHLILNQPTRNHSYLVDELNSMQVSYAHGNWLDVSDISKWDDVRHIELFTDTQASAFPMNASDWHDLIGERSCVIHDVMPEPLHNIAINNVYVRDVSHDGQHVINLEYTIRNTGSQAVNVPVTIDVDGETRNETVTELIPAGDKQYHKLQLTLEQPHTRPITVKLTTPDEIDWDNEMTSIIPQQFDPKVMTLGDRSVTQPMQRLFEAHHYQAIKQPAYKDTLLIASPTDTVQTQQIHDHIQHHGTVMWLLHDQPSVDAFATYVAQHIPDMTPTKWETRQTLVPDFWRWQWEDADNWLKPFKQGYESPLAQMTSSQVLLWDQPNTPDFKSQWQVIATHGGQPVVLWQWVNDTSMLVIAMPTADLLQRFKEPAMLSLFLRLGDYAVRFKDQLFQPYPGNPDFVGWPEWMPDVHVPANLIWQSGDKQITAPWDHQPVKRDKPGLYTLRKRYEPDMGKRLAIKSIRVHPKESVDGTKIDAAAYSNLGSQTVITQPSKRVELWHWLVLIALLLTCAETLLTRHLIKREVLHG